MLDKFFFPDFKIENPGADIFQIFDIRHQPVTAEIIILVERGLICPNRCCMRRYLIFQRGKIRLVNQTVFPVFAVDIFKRLREKFFARRNYQTVFRVRKNQFLFLPSAVGFDVFTKNFRAVFDNFGFQISPCFEIISSP